MTDVAETEVLSFRVLAGPVRGASAPLEHGRPLEIGHAFENDIVLRDAEAQGVRLRLRVKGEAAELDVLEGRVELLGHALEAPASAVLPRYVPLLIGRNGVAIGEEQSPRWAEAERLLRAAQRPDDADPRSDTGEEPRIASLLTRWHGLAARSQMVLPAVAIAAVSAAVLLAATTAPDWIRPTTNPAAVQAALAQAGFPTLKVVVGADGALAVKGLVATEKERARVQRVLQAKDFAVSNQVETGERLALAVEDVFRANGLDADARPMKLGAVRVDVRGAAEGEVASVQKLAAREVPGLRHLAVRRLGEPPAVAPTTPQPLVVGSGPGKRVVAVVDGQVDYVATEDGSRYFNGAVLPTGHRIVHVEGQIVHVEKDGAMHQLVF